MVFLSGEYSNRGVSRGDGIYEAQISETQLISKEENNVNENKEKIRQAKDLTDNIYVTYLSQRCHRKISFDKTNNTVTRVL